MEVIAGLIAATAIVGLGYALRQGRSLPFYGTVLVVIALAYVLFAVMAQAPRTIMVESGIAAVFIVLSVAAVRGADPRTAGFLMVFGLVAHGGYDLAHSVLVTNPVVPTWWPLFCGVVDVALGGWVLGVLKCEAVTGRDAA